MELNFYINGCRGTSPSTWHTKLVHRTRWRNSTTALDSCQQENYRSGSGGLARSPADDTTHAKEKMQAFVFPLFLLTTNMICSTFHGNVT
ncbi:hypothetical protein Hanom_Chr04g00356401 [Helianthus anomalus]